MNVTLTPDIEKFVQEKIDSGKYKSSNEVVMVALQHLQERESRLDALKKEIAVGIRQLDSGDCEEHDEESLRKRAEEIKLSGRRRLGDTMKRPS